MPRRLAQQRKTLSDTEWHHPHRALTLRQLGLLLVHIMLLLLIVVSHRLINVSDDVLICLLIAVRVGDGRDHLAGSAFQVSTDAVEHGGQLELGGQ